MVQQVLQRFDFTYSSPQATPLSIRHSLSALPSDESVEPSGPYLELVGCLMYLMTCTRPDLAYPLSILARYVAPGRHRPEHMAAAKRVLRYLCSTSGLGLVLGGQRPVVLAGHADASSADDQATQRSSQGYTFSLGSGSVSWQSTRSSSVLGSSCEAESYAGAMAAQDVRWLTYLLTDLGEQPRSPPVLGGGGGGAPGGGSFGGGADPPAEGGLTSGGAGPQQQQPQQQKPQQRQQQQQQVQQQWQAPQQFQSWDPHCRGVRSSTGPLRHSGDLEDPGALAAAAALPAGPLAPRGVTPAPATTDASPDRAVPVSAAATTTLRRGASAASSTSTVRAGYALYADVDHSADGSVCSLVRSLGCLPLASADLCLSSLGACVSALGACVASGPDTPPAEASLSFTMDSGALQCFFRDHTTLTPLLAPVLVALADPSSRPAIMCSSTTLPCPVVPSGVLRGLHIPSFTRNFVGDGYLLDREITVTFVGSGRTMVCTNAATGVVLATFTRESRSGLYVLHTKRSPVASSAQPTRPSYGTSALATCRSPASAALPVTVLSQVSRTSFRRSLSRLPHSALLPATAPFQTLHLDVWGPAPTLGLERERYVLVVVDNYSRYTMVFPLAKKSEPRVSWPEVSPTSIWTGSPGVGSAFHVWGCLALVRNTSADKLSARAILCVFLGFPVGSPHHSFYHPPLHQSLDPRDVRFDESVSYYTRYPYQGLPVPPPPLFLAPSPPPAPAPPQPSALPRQVTVDSVGVGAGGAGADGASSGGAGAGGCGNGGASSGGTGVGGAGTGGASSRGAGARGTSTRGASSGGDGAGGAGIEETGAGGSPTASPTARAGGEGEVGAAAVGPAAETTAAAAAADAAVATVAAAVPSSEWPSGPWSSFLSSCPLPVTYCVRSYVSSSGLDSGCFLSSSVTVVSFCCPARLDQLLSSACSALVSSCRPPHRLVSFSSLSFSTCVYSPLNVSSHPITEYYRAVRRLFSRVLSSLVNDPRASPSPVSALSATVADFASTRRLDYATRVVAAPPPRPLSVGCESTLGCDILEDRKFELEFLAAASPSLCAMLLSLKGDPDALDIQTPRTYREAMSGEWVSQWKAAMDAELASWRSTGTYVDAVPPPRANVVDDMWLFKVKRPPGSPPVFKARYVARGFSQREGGRLHEEIWLRHPPDFTDTFPPGTQWSLRQPVFSLRQPPREWHDTLRSTLRDLGFRPSSADPLLFVRTGSTPFFILVYVDDLVFATADRAALTEVKSELQKRHKCTDLNELQHYLGLQITRDRAARTITLTQSHMVQQVLQWFGFQFSTTQPTPLAVDHRLTGPFCDEPFESSGPYAMLVGCLMYLMTFVLTGHCDSSYADDVETQHSTQGYCFSLGAGAVSWRSTRLSFVALSSVEALIYAGAMAAQELRWLTFLLADLGERPCFALTLYADNKALILQCEEP
ncbi:unnamed protein product [Closterium sp. NIES-54]